jgi:hypothetical protein
VVGSKILTKPKRTLNYGFISSLDYGIQQLDGYAKINRRDFCYLKVIRLLKMSGWGIFSLIELSDVAKVRKCN